MTPDNPLAQALTAAQERLYEDERLRSELTDDEASFLLAWAQGQLEIAATSLGARAEDPDTLAHFENYVRRIRRAVRDINDLVGEKDTLSDDELSERLLPLLSLAGSPRRSLPIAARDLVKQRGELDGLAFVARLAAVVTDSWQVKGGSGAIAAEQPMDGGRPFFVGLLPLVVLAIVAVVVIAGFFFILRGQPAPTVPAPPTTSGGWYQLHFTSPIYPDNPSQRRGSLDEKLTAFIDTATTSVDMAIYQLDLENVTQSLLNARGRGAAVRVVTGTEIMEDPRENPSFVRLQAAGITVVAGNPNAIMHDKFVVVDGRAVWTGSWNFTANDTHRYNNNGILIESPELARNYTATFEKMWRDKQFGRQRKPGGTTPRLTIGGATVENYFAPEDRVAEKIVARLRTAQKSIDFMAFAFTDDEIGAMVRERAKGGVKVRGVFERTGSETQFSEYGRMKSDGLEVFQDGNPYLMHHKVFIIDGNTVVSGSFNFSQNAETSNDENLLIMDDQAMAGQFTSEFERVLAQAKEPPRK